MPDLIESRPSSSPPPLPVRTVGGLDDGEGTPNFPLVVSTILGMNALIFVLQSATGGSTNTFNLVRFGAQHGASIENGEYWRFITAAFLHIGILHFLVNAICLWQLGRLLERLYGATHFAFLYLASGVGGTLTSFFLNEFVSPQTVSAGASGAIFGVAGAMLVAGLRYSDQIPESIERAFGTGILPFIAFNLYYGLTRGGIDNYAHVGGVLTGAVVGLVLHPYRENRRDTRIAAAGFAALVLLCFGFQYRAVSNYEHRVQSALALYQSGRFADAESAANALRTRGSEDVRVLTLASLLHLRQGKIKEAWADLRVAERIGPRYVPAKIVRGDLMMRMGNFSAATASFLQVIRLEPTNSIAHLGLGGALLAQDRVEEAATAFRDALRLDPKLPRGHYGLGVTLERQDRFAEAAEAYRQAVKLDPELKAARHGLARVLLQQGQRDAAIAELRKALEIDPNDRVAQRMIELNGAQTSGQKSPR